MMPAKCDPVLTCSLVSEDLPLLAMPTASKQMCSASLTNGARTSSSKPGGGQLSKISETLTGQSGEGDGYSQQEFLANPQVEPASNEARLMTAGSGRKLCACLPKQSLIGAFSRILLESETWGSTEYLLRWRALATKSRRYSIFQLARLTPRNSGTDITLWGTPRVSRGQYCSGKNGAECITLEGQVKRSWPTPRGTDEKLSHQNPGHGNSLPGALRMWPTPASRDWKSPNSSQSTAERNARPLNEVLHSIWPTPNAAMANRGRSNNLPAQRGHAKNLPDYLPARGTATYGCLAQTDKFGVRLATLSCWLMGYTAAYFKHWAIASSGKSRRKSSPQ